jgi:hypothetical protein
MVSWSFVPESSTIYAGVKRLSPATRLEIDLDSGARRSRTYWELHPNDDAAKVTSLEEACTNVEALLRRSVREHLESDVPVATFLSGGIDSSLITALAAEESSRPLKVGGITKQGNQQIRRQLVLGATSILRCAGKRKGRLAEWIVSLRAKKPARLVTVAVANKLARIIWAMMKTGECFRDELYAKA